MDRDQRQVWAPGTAPQDGRLEIVIQADPRAAAAVADGVSRLLEARGWPEVRIAEVQLALQEALANAIRHGCRSDPSRDVRCLVTCDERGDLTLVIRDPGDGFEASAVADPLSPENVLKPGGRGVFLINRLMDTVDYRDGGREIEMRKRRHPHPPSHPLNADS
jgi:serine/threonine-protein kinase RsbW